MVILSAIDGEESSETVVETGYDLATAFGEELVVLHVMPQEQFERISDRFNEEESVTYPVETKGNISISTSTPEREGYPIDAAMENAETVAKDGIPESIGEETEIKTRGRVGEPTEEISKEIEKIDARYLVIGGRKRSPVGKALFGSTTQSILLNTDRPVMTCMHQK